MLKYIRFSILIILFSFYFSGISFAAERLGSIVEIEGSVTIISNGKSKKANIDDALFLGDMVVTGKNSRAFIFLIDNTEFTLSENAKFKLKEYNYNPENIDENKARYSVMEGAFRYVSGLVAKKDNPDIEVETPFGSIGIRGTDFTVAKETSGGYEVYLDSGEINVRNEKGASLLKPGQGTIVRGRHYAPSIAKRWDKNRIAKLRKAVHLKRKKQIYARIEKIRKQRKEKFFQLHKNKGNLKEKFHNKLELDKRLKDKKGLKHKKGLKDKLHDKKSLENRLKDKRNKLKQRGEYNNNKLHYKKRFKDKSFNKRKAKLLEQEKLKKLYGKKTIKNHNNKKLNAKSNVPPPKAKIMRRNNKHITPKNHTKLKRPKLIRRKK